MSAVSSDPTDARVLITTHPGHVGEVRLNRPPNNFFDVALIRAVARAYDDFDADPECRVILLSSEGKHFCAGADFSPKERTPEEAADEANLYWEAVRLFKGAKPVVAVVQGGAIGGGLGLACSADFRIACRRLASRRTSRASGSTTVSVLRSPCPRLSAGSARSICSIEAGGLGVKRPMRSGSATSWCRELNCVRRRWRTPRTLLCRGRSPLRRFASPCAATWAIACTLP